MPYSAGAKVGQYDILAPLGAGGMGEVYRARDSKLNREVALKFLSASFLGDPDRSARFAREAQVLASLNHPNIAALYGLEEQTLVMELVEGATLEQRLQAGPLPLNDALEIARQIAEAVEYAHDKGVVHRDLKPANVKITPEGTVKVLDFGLAKIADASVLSGNPANSPTLTLNATQAGVIMGTAGYMSPEQASGRPADRRADIWSFGVILWEMLCGSRLFDGETVSHTLADVLRAQLDFERLPAGTPPAMRELVSRCLDRSVKTRLQSIGEARIAIQRYLADPSAPTVGPVEVQSGAASGTSRIAWALAIVLAVVCAALFYRNIRGEVREPVALSLRLDDEGVLSIADRGVFGAALSPDGRRIGLVAGGALWVRDLSAPGLRKIAEQAGSPFWSPDSRHLGFFVGRKLIRVAAAGGPAQTIADMDSGGRATWVSWAAWSKDDVILFANREGTFRVPAAGGPVTQVLAPDKDRKEDRHYAPSFLPDGRHFLISANVGERAKSAVFVADLQSKTKKLLLSVPTNAVYVEPGYVLYVKDRTLIAQPFDVKKLELFGEAVPLAKDVTYNYNLAYGLFTASQTGTLLYMSGSSQQESQLTWFDRSGKALGTVGEPGDMEVTELSPDGTRVVSVRADGQTGRFDLWMHDLVRKTESRFTFDGSNRFPVWSPDGTQIVFDSSRNGARQVYRKPANGTQNEEVIVPSTMLPKDWSRDGRYILFDTPNQTPKTGNDIWVLPLFGDRKIFPYIRTEFNEGTPKLSPDGKWMVYHSDESSRQEVYVTSFPTPGAKTRVSTDGGYAPVWSRDGRELYFVNFSRQIMAVDVKPGAQFETGTPKALFEVGIPFGNMRIDVSRDGRFLVPVLKNQGSTPMSVMLNWPSMLKN